jgi:hypothetical protein
MEAIIHDMFDLGDQQCGPVDFLVSITSKTPNQAGAGLIALLHFSGV